MTSVFAAHRAAEEFAALVDGTRTDAADRYAPLHDVVTLLATQPRVEARAAFVADLRARLMTAADVELSPSAPVLRAVPSRTTTARPAVRPRRLGTAAAAALVVVGGTAGMAAASHGALPGDGLYNVKRSIEAVTTALSTGDADKGSDLLSHASTRLHEVRALSRSDDADPAQITATLQDFSNAASQGASLLFRSYEQSGRSSDISAVREFAADQHAALAALGDVAPPDARKALAAATEQVDAIDTEALSLCAGCGGSDVGTRFDDVRSSAALHALLSVPAAVRPKAPRTRTVKAPAHVAPAPSTSTAGQTAPPPAAPTTGATLPPAPTGGAGDVTSDLGAATQPVTDLVDQVGTSTGLSALTDPLTGLIKGLGK